MTLQQEIEDRRHTIRTDSYSMSVGEIMNLYTSKELHINPNFQRMFRWTEQQKTRLIESLLLGIPLPPIFVSMRESGVWDLIDGLQRLSTIFEFAGILRKTDGQLYNPSVLTKAKYLTSLQGKSWGPIGEDGDVEQSENTLTTQQRILIKRAKLDVNIIVRGDENDAQYDLFERINTGGSKLSDQEVRNCLLIMANVDFYDWFESLRNDENFSECIGITDRAKDERYDMELATRYLVLRSADMAQVREKMVDVGTYLSEAVVQLARSDLDRQLEEATFRKTFSMINLALGPAAFRRWDAEKERYLGMSQVSAFEAISLGLGFNVDSWDPENPEHLEAFKGKVKDMWQEDNFLSKQGSGVRGTDRILSLVPFARDYFAQ